LEPPVPIDDDLKNDVAATVLRIQLLIDRVSAVRPRLARERWAIKALERAHDEVVYALKILDPNVQ
jgi:hypothetical protein